MVACLVGCMVGLYIAFLVRFYICWLLFLIFVAYCFIIFFSWAGLYDGRYDDCTLRELALQDDKYERVRQNVRKCEIVIIDEVSMLSKKDFEQMELVCRVIKDNKKVFGGIQVVACGDFYQLPPVGNALYDDSGEFCFQSEIWKALFKHRINFDVVLRQCEEIFIKSVRETAIGSISEETDAFLKSLNRELKHPHNETHLFPRNVDAAIYNSAMLDQLETTGRTYTGLFIK